MARPTKDYNGKSFTGARPVEAQFGEYMRKMREAAGLSRTELVEVATAAQFVGGRYNSRLSVEFLYKLESGRITPSRLRYSYFRLLGAVFRVSPDALALMAGLVPPDVRRALVSLGDAAGDPVWEMVRRLNVPGVAQVEADRERMEIAAADEVERRRVARRGKRMGIGYATTAAGDGRQFEPTGPTRR